jgi:small subunit ribosomal protein S18
VSAPQAAAAPHGGYRGGGPSRGGPRSGERRGRSRFIPRRKVCSFCVEHITAIDYKRIDGLRRYLSERGKIEPRRKTGTCAKHQRMLTQALKRERHLAHLPYTLQHVLDSGIEVGIHRSY